MDTIKCSVCGEVNPANLEYCRNCQTRLETDTGILRNAGGPIQPGQAPTKKTTAELEPILPQWLRDARDEARQGAEDEAGHISPSAQPQPASPNNQAPDLLAGLQSQSSDEDESETPDWLANITGVTLQPKKSETDEMESRRVELGTEDVKPIPPGVHITTNRDTASQTSSEVVPDAPLPAWLTGMDSSQPAGGDELADLFSRSAAQPENKAGADQLDLSRTGLGAGDALSQLSDQTSEPESSDWLKNLQAEQSASEPVEAHGDVPYDMDVPDWLKDAQASAPVENEPKPVPAADTPDWVKDLDATASAKSAEPVPSGTPDWLKDFASEADVPASSGDTPDWLKNIEQVKPITVEPKPAPSSNTPDWLKSFGQSDVIREPVVDETTAHENLEPAAAPVTSHTESQNDVSPFFPSENLSGEELNSLFTQMPDWLSSTPSDSKPVQDMAPAAQGTESISPANLPSWVQAMRPVESALSQTLSQGIGPSEQTLETHGPLAGLQGVLPSMPFGPTSKPKAYSIKLQASDEQQAHAALLGHIIEAETTPEPLVTVPFVISSRGLRWAITMLLLLVTIGSLFAGTQIFAMPLGMPVELNSAIRAVDNVPENAPVLVIFDYDPSTVGEMEAISAPLLDHLILLRHPRLAFISTSPTGAALAERFISGPLGGHAYQSGIQYVNLGFLPGGLAGIRAFAQAPRIIAPDTIDLNPAWQSATLQDVQSLSDFSLILLLTDGAESGRNWVEQAGALHDDVPFVVASSAQAGPMILPYVQSGQVNGLVNGLNSGAVMEQNNSGRPGTARRYWDAYSLGLFLAVAFIAFGGLWNLLLGYRARAQAEKGDE